MWGSREKEQQLQKPEGSKAHSEVGGAVSWVWPGVWMAGENKGREEGKVSEGLKGCRQQSQDQDPSGTLWRKGPRGSGNQWRILVGVGGSALLSERMAALQCGRQPRGRELGEGWEMASGNQMKDDDGWTGEINWWLCKIWRRWNQQDLGFLWTLHSEFCFSNELHLLSD